MKRLVVAAVLCSAAVATPAVAGLRSYRCYGSREVELAQSMLQTIPYLGTALRQHEWQVKQLRLRTCMTVAKTGRLPKVGHADEFFEDSRNRAIKVVADDQHVNRLRLLAALADLLWPPKEI